MRLRLVAVLSFFFRLRMKRKGVTGLDNARLAGMPIVRLVAGSTISIARGFVATSWASFQVIGVPHAVILRTLTPTASISIGENCGVSGAAIVAAERITIGTGCLIGSGALIVDTDFHPVNSANRRFAPLPEPVERHRVTIGDNVFIGARAIVLKGTTIGDNAVIGAGSVVSGSVPANSVFAGNPAVSIKQIDLV